MKNIVLIGMPGVGKSTVGVILAKVLNMNFLDSDLVIQQKSSKRLSQLISSMGNDGFKSYEEKVNCGINAKNSVIATGGSAVYSEKAMTHFKKKGLIIYLQTSFENLDKRLGNLDARGVVHNKGATIKDIFEERKVLYEKYADIIINEDGLNVADTVDAIVLEIEKRGIA